MPKKLTEGSTPCISIDEAGPSSSRVSHGQYSLLVGPPAPGIWHIPVALDRYRPIPFAADLINATWIEETMGRRGVGDNSMDRRPVLETDGLDARH